MTEKDDIRLNSALERFEAFTKEIINQQKEVMEETKRFSMISKPLFIAMYRTGKFSKKTLSVRFLKLQSSHAGHPF